MFSVMFQVIYKLPEQNVAIETAENIHHAEDIRDEIEQQFGQALILRSQDIKHLKTLLDGNNKENSNS